MYNLNGALGLFSCVVATVEDICINMPGLLKSKYSYVTRAPLGFVQGSKSLLFSDISTSTLSLLPLSSSL